MKDAVKKFFEGEISRNDFLKVLVNSLKERCFLKGEFRNLTKPIEHGTEEILPDFCEFFPKILTLGYIPLKCGTDDREHVALFAVTCAKELSERSYRRKQFDFAQKIADLPGQIKIWFDANYSDPGNAVFLFIAPDGKSFRLSLIERDKSKEKKIFKRYTFFVSADQSNRTFCNRIGSGKKWETFADLKEAFSVEKLSDDFFKAYTETHYQDFVSYATGVRMGYKGKNWVVISRTDPNKEIMAQFAPYADPDKALRDYVKKMMGRLVFLQFLQKRGWLGVPEGAEWGNGDKEYLKKLFDSSSYQDDFLEKVLEPLFFETLNKDRKPEKDIADAVLAVNDGKVRIPYLNGGLFEKDELDKAKIKFPAEYFARLFDTFERYNFTIDENEPDDKEVGVDPEMLGRIFENLLEDNKDKGAFYTPKEIVQYMCEESLIAYLGDTEANRKLVKDFDVADITDTDKKALLEKLEDVKICDPAIGSGAFPMGMLNILYRIRMKLESLDDTAENIVRIKKEIIQNNIYGVDIEAGAVDIARLRFWLSIVVDEDKHKPIPLPNLDYKIMQGNSLLESFNGIDLSKITLAMKKSASRLSSKALHPDMLAVMTDDDLTPQAMRELMKYYYDIHDPEKKAEIRQRLNLRIARIMKESIFHHPEEVAKVDAIDWSNKNFFLWRTYFMDVFEKGGFDIVIGNPPYVSTKGRTEDENTALEAEYDFADDLYSHFIIQGFRLLKENGIQCQITSDTYFTTLTKQNVREALLKNTFINLVHWGHDIFDSAMVSTATFVSKKQKCCNEHIFDVWDVKGKKSIVDGIHYRLEQKEYHSSINRAFFIPNEFNIELNNKFASKHKKLLANWWEKINKSSNISKNKEILNEYRDNLEAGDLTLIGLVTDGGQGLATANNGKYVGVLPHTKAAENIRSSRIKKLAEFNKKYKTNYELPVNELEIWNLFDSLKEQYGRDCFGQGYIFRIVPKDMLADVSALTEDEKINGIISCASFVPYDKGDRDGNRWYLETPYVIDWSRNNVSFMKNDRKARFQNTRFYFKEGFCYSDIKTFFIRCRLKGQSVHDVKSMSLFPISERLPFYYIVTMINSHLTASLVYNFLNNTPSFQMNDCRMLPIVVPTDAQLKKCKQLFDKAIDLQKQFFAGVLNKEERDKKLQDIQDRIDDFVYNLYGINCTDYLNHNNSVFEKTVASDDKNRKGKKAGAVAVPVVNDVDDEYDGDI